VRSPIPASWSQPLLSVLRVVATFLYMAHGTQKLFGWPADQPQHTVALFSLMGLAGVLETFGGLLLLLGLFSRPVAFLLAGEMAFAYFMAHAPRGFWPLLNRGETPVLLCFIFLYLAAQGPGPWSLDSARSRSRATD
jgi:putative oxidoreductase